MQGIDLFSGAGGMSIGATFSGIDVKYAVEVDKSSAQTFVLNHKNTHLLNKDIRETSISDFKLLDRNEQTIVFGGPPCQGFSTSNQKSRNRRNESNWLFREFMRVVSEIRPEWIVFENVKGLIETEDGYFLDEVIEAFSRLGYSTLHYILNSADFGVPQNRNRLFIVGSLNGGDLSAPVPICSKHVTVKEAIQDLPIVENGNIVDTLTYSSNPKNKYARKLRNRKNRCSNNLVTRNARHIVERYKCIPQGGNWEDIPLKLMKNYSNVSRCHTGIYRRLLENEPSVVIGNFRKNMLIHPWEDRGLSVREAARLQSIPDNFTFCGSIGFQQQQVGNLVPPPMAKAVFETFFG